MYSLSNKFPVQTDSIIIVHPQSRIRSLLRRVISMEGYKVFEAVDSHDAAAIARQEDVGMILCDKESNGLDDLSPDRKRTLFPYADILSLPLADATREDAQLLLSVISHTLKKMQLEKRVRQLEEYIEEEPETDYSIGESSAIRELVAMIKKIAPSDEPVLLQGESGTGKQLFARSLHTGSARRNNPFITLHCKTLTEASLEIELFGCKAGAFPGISKERTGAFEKAYKGSLLLTDIDHLPTSIQQKLLRALTDHSFTKPGETTAAPLNIRLFATTRNDLLPAVRKGSFDEDFYYRLNAFNLHVPSLRDRKMDIPLLARHFMKYFARKADRAVKDINKEFLYHLQRYSWKGNIRELRNIMERAVIMTENNQLSEDNLPFEIRYFQNDTLDIRSAFDLKTLEKRHLQKVLTYTRGNKVEAARLLNIGLTTLYRKINEYSN